MSTGFHLWQGTTRHASPGLRVRPPLSKIGFLAAALGFAVSVTLVVAAVVTAIVLAGA